MYRQSYGDGNQFNVLLIRRFGDLFDPKVGFDPEELRMLADSTVNSVTEYCRNFDRPNRVQRSPYCRVPPTRALVLQLKGASDPDPSMTAIDYDPNLE